MGTFATVANLVLFKRLQPLVAPVEYGLDTLTHHQRLCCSTEKRQPADAIREALEV